MRTLPIYKVVTSFSRWKLFLGLSRTPHALLDMATPGLASILWLGGFPPVRTMVLGIITVFAGYTAVYALNDVIDLSTDREKIRRGGFQDSGDYLDAAIVRHPIAQGLLSLKEGLLWVAVWSVLSLIGAYLLNPVCILIFIAGAFLEVVYCLMWRISPFRTIVSGAVKTCGAVAAVFAVDPSPSLSLLAILFLWLFFWEIGGQNIPNDWAEIEEDTTLKAKTILVQFGPHWAGAIIFACLLLTITMNLVLFAVARHGFSMPYLAASFVIGLYLLLMPGYRLVRTRQRFDALVLFNRASYYPLALLMLVAVDTLI
jgi:4-hydroxybenzoate polyprenyltransferase